MRWQAKYPSPNSTMSDSWRDTGVSSSLTRNWSTRGLPPMRLTDFGSQVVDAVEEICSTKI